MTTKLLVPMLFCVSVASAQQAELGVTGGFGAFGDYGRNSSGGQFGAEACVLCSGRFAVFGEYTHWFTGQGDVFGFRSAVDLGGGGLRIQSSNRLSPFVDVGVFGGQDRHGGLGGVVVGAGVRVPLGERWYVRPQVRVYGSFHTAAIASVGIGYRF